METDPVDSPAPEMERVLLSYDASGSARAMAARACRIVFGFERRVTRKGVIHAYRRAGFLDRPGARRLGQSVFLLREGDARELAAALSRLGLRVRTLRVRVSAEDLRAFSQGMRISRGEDRMPRR